MVSLSIVYSQQSRQPIGFYRSPGLEPISKRTFVQGSRNLQTNPKTPSREVQYPVISFPQGIDSKTLEYSSQRKLYDWSRPTSSCTCPVLCLFFHSFSDATLSFTFTTMLRSLISTLLPNLRIFSLTFRLYFMLFCPRCMCWVYRRKGGPSTFQCLSTCSSLQVQVAEWKTWTDIPSPAHLSRAVWIVLGFRIQCHCTMYQLQRLFLSSSRRR